VANFLLTLASDFDALLNDATEFQRATLETVVQQARETEEEARTNSNDQGGYWHKDFGEERLGDIRRALDDAAQSVGLSDDDPIAGEDEPTFFPVGELPRFVDALAAGATGRDVSQFVDSLNLRIRGLFAKGPLASVAAPSEAKSITLTEWLDSYVGADEASNGPLALIDLSLVPSDSLHVVVAVIARLIFEAMQRYRRETAAELPTVLVLDEAHAFIHRDLMAEGGSSAGRTCCRVFERIAREGRKFGLGLVLASQRPSEISPTVLSQCNTFLLHRIVNDADQKLVRHLVPDGLGDLLGDLPSLPSRRAVLLGWGAPAPLLVEVRELPNEQRPHSPDPAFWDVWTGRAQRNIDWPAIVEHWTSPLGTHPAPGTDIQADPGESSG